MSPPRNPLPLLLLVFALVAYFLPWFEWTCVTKVAYSESFQRGLQGLPEEMKPRHQYEQRQHVAPAGVALGWSDITTTNDPPHVMDQFTSWLPTLHFGPRYNATSRFGFVIGGVSLLVALVGGWRYRGLAFVGSLGAVVGVAIALATEPHLGKYLTRTHATEDMELPTQFTMHYTMHYTTTSWFYVGTTSIVLALAFMVFFGRKKKAP